MPRVEIGPAELVAGASAREDWATDELWRRYHGLVRSVVVRTFGPHHDSSDLVQESFIQIFGSIGSLRDTGALRSFVIGITVRVVRSELRRRRVRSFLRLTPTGEVPDQPTSGRDDEAREAVRRLYRALDQSSVDERLIFTMRHLEGLELTEVAMALELSLATVNRKLRKATDRLTALAANDPVLGAYVDHQGGGRR